jgi:hypothetical protein
VSVADDVLPIFKDTASAAINPAGKAIKEGSVTYSTNLFTGSPTYSRPAVAPVRRCKYDSPVVANYGLPPARGAVFASGCAFVPAME